MIIKTALVVAIMYTASMIVMMGYVASTIIDIVKGINDEENRCD